MIIVTLWCIGIRKYKADCKQKSYTPEHEETSTSQSKHSWNGRHETKGSMKGCWGMPLKQQHTCTCSSY